MRRRWATWRDVVLRAALVLMTLYAGAKLGSEFPRLLFEPSRTGATDLKLRHAEVARWFAREPVYPVLPDAVYPPASYALLWPALGWSSIDVARWTWAVVSAASLAALSWLLVATSGAKRWDLKLLVAVLPLSLNATGVGIGGGQLSATALLLAVGAARVVERTSGRWRGDLAGAMLLAASLIKPTVTAPFVCLALTSRRGRRVLAIAAILYASLTAVAVAFQPAPIGSLARSWIANAQRITPQGYGTLHSWLGAIGLEAWSLWASAVAIAGLGLWLATHRYADWWIRVGVVGLVARFWAHHRIQDDVLICLPMVALFRIAQQGPRTAGDRRDIGAGVLLALTIAVMMIPARFSLVSSPFVPLYNAVHAIVWIVLLWFLIRVSADPPHHAGAADPVARDSRKSSAPGRRLGEGGEGNSGAFPT